MPAGGIPVTNEPATVLEPQRMVAVASFTDLTTAEVALGMLESEGLPASIPNAQLVGLDWRMSNALGGIVVQVPAEFEAQAREILEGVATPTAATVSDHPGPACPFCGSCESRADRSRKRLLALTLLFPPLVLLAIPAYLLSRGMLECLSCGKYWTPER